MNPPLLEILRAAHEITRKLGCDYLLVGATARDILMNNVFGLATWRATHDVDFAIALDSWERFESLKAALVASGEFALAPGNVHLLLYKPVEHDRAFPLDLIPFGGVEQEAHRIVWPPDMNVVMSVAGYAEALTSAQHVDTGTGLIIRVVSIPALAALKLLAWNDRGLQDSKDAHDLLFLLQNYHEAGNGDRMYGEAFSLLEDCGFDLPLAGATLLGRDTAVILQNDSLHALSTILSDPRKRDRLIVHMTRADRLGTDMADRLLSQFELGLRTKTQ